MTRARAAWRTQDLNWRQIAGAGVLCGIRFTMSFFIADLAFTDPEVLAPVKLGVMLASVVAGTLGWIAFRGFELESFRRTRWQAQPHAAVR